MLSMLIYNNSFTGDEAMDIEKQRAYRRAWYERNKERVREARQEATRKWRKANPSSYRASYTEQNQKRKEAQRKYHSRPEVKERRTELQRQRRAADPESYKQQAREGHLKKKFGLTTTQFDQMFAAQGNKCAGCGEADEIKAKRWCVDHCHDTQKVRGILCYHCNVLLGLARDNSKTLRQLAAYLEGNNEN